MKEYKHDFAFGDTRGIRKIMSDMIYKEGLTSNVLWQDFGYPPHEGDAKLIHFTRKIIRDLTGHSYNHVLITNGATHALNAYIDAVRTKKTTKMVSHDKYFMFYPGIAKNHGLIHAPKKDIVYASEEEIAIIASPSNPEGRVYGPENFAKNVIWDAAYYTPTYCPNFYNISVCVPIQPIHDAIAGSYNKLTGINGLRVGWLATDSDIIYQKALEFTEHDICGVSYPSQYMALMIAKYIDLPVFYMRSAKLIDSNKNELSRLNYLFGNQKIPRIGMFALLEADKKLKKLLEKASVNVMDGRLCGDDRDSIRFNMANENEATKAMVDAILKADKKK